MSENNPAEIHQFNDFIHSPVIENDFGYVFHSGDSLPHTHQGFAEFTLIVHGTWESGYGGRRVKMERNSLTFFGSDTTHEWKVLTPTGNHFTFFFRKEYFEAFCKTYFPEQKRLTEQRYYHTILKPSVTDFLLDEADILVSSRTKAGHAEQLRNYLHNLIYFCFISEKNIPQTTTEYTHGAHLKVHLDRFEWLTLSLQEIYDIFPVSKSTLIKEFRLVTGKTIVEYRNNKRMEYAAQLLKKWDYTIAEVASKVGISSMSYFSHQFKAYYGVLPKKYRSQHCW